VVFDEGFSPVLDSAASFDGDADLGLSGGTRRPTTAVLMKT
jgi:hypothetical protein